MAINLTDPYRYEDFIKAFAAKHPPPSYLTIGPNIYLGRRASKGTRANAKAAGLSSVTLKDFRKLYLSMGTIKRMRIEGRWYDTVKY